MVYRRAASRHPKVLRGGWGLGRGGGLGLVMVPRPARAGVQPAHGDQAEPEVADLGEQPVQRWLVGEQARQLGLIP